MTVNTFQSRKTFEKGKPSLKGFRTFFVISNVLTAEIEPKIMYSIAVAHFCGRYPEEHFLIYDRTHGMALVYRPYQSKITPIEDFLMPEPDPEEQVYREMWQLFYNSIEVEGRHNPKCRMSHMPKRYWKYMTEFENKDNPLPKLNKPGQKK